MIRYKYFINGYRYGREYFMSFGFSESQIQRMIDGEIIKHNGSAFWIECEEI